MQSQNQYCFRFFLLLLVVIFFPLLPPPLFTCSVHPAYAQFDLASGFISLVKTLNSKALNRKGYVAEKKNSESADSFSAWWDFLGKLVKIHWALLWLIGHVDTFTDVPLSEADVPNWWETNVPLKGGGKTTPSACKWGRQWGIVSYHEFR